MQSPHMVQSRREGPPGARGWRPIEHARPAGASVPACACLFAPFHTKPEMQFRGRQGGGPEKQGLGADVTAPQAFADERFHGHGQQGQCKRRAYS